MKELQEIYRRCESTASWFDLVVQDINQVNHLGDTPLHTVCSWGELAPVKVLLENGADINKRGDGDYTPLMKAVNGENIEVIKYLLLSGADKQAKTDRGFTALGLAKLLDSSKEIIVALS